MARKRNKTKNDSLKWVWKGPKIDGVTQSILREFLQCRERCRIKLQLGLAPREEFSIKLSYGKMFHAYLDGNLDDEYHKLCQEFPEQRETLSFWKKIVIKQGEAYINYWEDYKFIANELKIDTNFHGYRLRGKVDGIAKIEGNYWLIERKTTSNIDDRELVARVNFDLQTGFYTSMLDCSRIRVAGVHYDVIRRPLSGGKYSYRQKAGESVEEYIDRVCSTFFDDPKYYFQRYMKLVTPKDVDRFNEKFLLPILNEMNEWYETLKNHWIMPNGILRKSWDALDDYIHSGGTVNLGLTQYKLFSELEDNNDNQD